MQRLLAVLVFLAISVRGDTYGDWQYAVSNDAVTITGYTGSDDDIVIPSEINGIPVKVVDAIQKPEINGSWSFQRVTIPICVDSVQRPLPYAFELIFLGNAPLVFGEDGKGVPSRIIKIGFGSSGWGTNFEGWPVIMTNAYALAVRPDSTNGTTSTDPIGPWHGINSSVNIHAVPQPGYSFSSWSGDEQSTNNPLYVTMNTNKTVTANFSPDNTDTDGDGLSNYQEAVIFHTNPNQAETNSPVNGLYLASQRQSERTAGQNDVLNNPSSYGLYTSNQIHNLGLGGIVLNRDNNNQLTLNYQVMQSTDLQNWTTYQQNELVISNAASEKMFLRVQAVGQ